MNTTVDSIAAPARVAVAGLGQQGLGVAALLQSQGYELVGGVDIGDKVGKRISDLGGGVTGEAVIHGSVDDLLAAVSDIDVVILAAAVPLPIILGQAETAMKAGINVLTLHQDAFEADGDWVPSLQALGEETGASFLSTGVQDQWWVQMPSVAGGSTTDITRVEVDHLIDLDSISPAIMREWGIAATEADFIERVKPELEKLPPILGAPLRLAARALGLTPQTATSRIDPIVFDHDMAWSSAEETIPAGDVIGTVETTEFATDEGVTFVGYLRLRALESHEKPSDVVTIDATPPLRLEHTPFPGQQVTNIVIVNRIADVLRAAGGVYTAADLGPARYLHPAARR